MQRCSQLLCTCMEGFLALEKELLGGLESYFERNNREVSDEREGGK